MKSLRMYDLIDRKKRGEKLTKTEIAYIVDGYTKGEIPDYQMSAFLMAVCCRGMDMDETVCLTMSMAKSGDMLDLSAIHGLKADKHSTGGVGDKTSLIIGPMVASLGVPVAKMSGRGLGHTGGTIDKLESFPGFSVNLSEDTFFRNVNSMKLSIVGQTANLAPADKKIYALRDVTATVDNISLIAASIMSKKLASGADVIVLDVKTGSGAFMKNYEDAYQLADTMVQIGNGVGRKTYAVITDMNQPLGNTVGNVLEVQEAISCLQGNGQEDLMAVCYELAALMLLGVGRARSVDDAKRMLKQSIADGSALQKLAEFVTAQGGDAHAIYDFSMFAQSRLQIPVYAPQSGYISQIKTDEIGMTSLILGGGRETKESVIDPAVGIRLQCRLGDYMEAGSTMAVLYANDETKAKLAQERYLSAYTFSSVPVERNRMIYNVITDENMKRG